MDVEWRRQRAIEGGIVPTLVGLLKVLLPLQIPVALLEGFADYRNAVLAFPVPRPKAAYSANGLHGHMAWKLLLAEWRQQGTLLLYHQHGGGYGLDRIRMRWKTMRFGLRTGSTPGVGDEGNPTSSPFARHRQTGFNDRRNGEPCPCVIFPMSQSGCIFILCRARFKTCTVKRIISLQRCPTGPICLSGRTPKITDGTSLARCDRLPQTRHSTMARRHHSVALPKVDSLFTIIWVQRGWKR